MNDIKNLEEIIIVNSDKILFREAIKCLESKTYRAGYIIAWISIVESLKRKINSLANTGDIQSKQSSDKIEVLEKNHKSADIQIITEALNISLVENDDYTKLLFLWNQRCLFAHPYEKAPNEGELIFIIQQAIDITLSKKLEFKKNYINELIENLLNKPHFLSSDIAAIESYAENIIPKIHKDLHSFFYKSILAKIGEIKTDETKAIALKRLRTFSFTLLKMTTDKLDEPNWRMEDSALNYTYEFVLATCNAKIWSKLPLRCQELVLEFILQQEESIEKQHIVKILSKIYKTNLFSKPLEIKFEDFLSSRIISDTYENYKNELLLFDRMVIEFDSGDYYRQQDAIRILKNDFGQTFQNLLNMECAIQLGRRITNAADRGCFEAKEALNYGLFRFTNNFKLGIVIGAFMDREMSFRWESGILFKVFNIIDELDDEAINSIMSFINGNKKIDNAIHSHQSYQLKSYKASIDHMRDTENLSAKRGDFLSKIYEQYI